MSARPNATRSAASAVKAPRPAAAPAAGAASRRGGTSSALAPPAGAAAHGTVTALERGFALLHCFEPEGGTLGNGELARRTGIPKSTVTRLTRTLVRLGYLAPAPEPERFRLAAGVLRLSRVFLDEVDVRALARPHMERLADATGATTLLAVPDGAGMVVIEACRARASLVLLRLDVGSRIGMANSALGRAHLASLPSAELDAALAALGREIGAARGFPDAALARALREARGAGFALSLGEVHADVNSVAVALQGPAGEPMALNCGGPVSACPEARLREQLAPLLAGTARAIARDIGGSARAVAPTRGRRHAAPSDVPEDADA